MPENLQEFVNSRGAAIRVDAAAGVVRGVKILGLASRNGRSYKPEALAAAIHLYEGAKVNVNHPRGAPTAPRDYQDRIGVIRQVALRPEAGLFGDFHFNPKHALAEQLIWDAEHAPENVGFSHNVEARVTRQGDQAIVEAIERVRSIDLVADPATTRGLFEGTSAAGAASRVSSGEDHRDENPAATLAAASLADLRQRRPDLVAALLQEHQAETALLREEVARLAARAAVKPQSREQFRQREEESPRTARDFAKAIQG